MPTKQWCRLVAFLLVSSAALILALVIIVDPFEVYHRAIFYQPPYASETQMYTNAGVARHYEYDSIIIGSSVTENCRPSVFDKALGGRFVKLCMNGGTAHDHAKMMDVAFATHDVKRVVYGLDLFAYSIHYTNQRAVTPDYLYDDTALNDIPYLFNKAVLLRYIPEAFARIGTEPDDSARDSMYYWDPPYLPSEEEFCALVDLASPLAAQKPDDHLEAFTQGNLENNLLRFVQAHPDTTFSVFFPPYSQLYWAQQAREGVLDARLAQRLQLTQALLKAPNVALYDFSAHTQWTQDFGLYFDLVHYVPTVNDAMAEAIADDACRILSVEQIEENNRALKTAALSFFESP